nr:Vestitone reductase [Ipomoea batatas]
MAEGNDKGCVCVTGGTGFLASRLIMKLLQQGYAVNATVRSHPGGSPKDASFLTSLEGAPGRLRIFVADLDNPESFSPAIEGCVGVFHVAQPMPDLDDPEDDDEAKYREAVRGAVRIFELCVKAGTVKRVVYTSSESAMVFNGEGAEVVDESCWSDVEYIRSSISREKAYSICKTMIEKAGFEFAHKSGLDLVTVIPPYIHGPFITPQCPYSVRLSMAWIFGDNDPIIEYQSVIPFVHVDDLASAHIFVFEHPNAEGRVSKEKGFKYPKESSKKLLDAGFQFKYGLEDMFDGAIECCKQRVTFYQHPVIEKGKGPSSSKSPKAPWADLFRKSEETVDAAFNLSFCPLVNGTAVLEESEIWIPQNTWKFGLLRCFARRFPGLDGIDALVKSWKGEIEGNVVDCSNSFEIQGGVGFGEIEGTDANCSSSLGSPPLEPDGMKEVVNVSLVCEDPVTSNGNEPTPLDRKPVVDDDALMESIPRGISSTTIPMDASLLNNAIIPQSLGNVDNLHFTEPARPDSRSSLGMDIVPFNSSVVVSGDCWATAGGCSRWETVDSSSFPSLCPFAFDKEIMVLYLKANKASREFAAFQLEANRVCKKFAEYKRSSSPAEKNGGVIPTTYFTKDFVECCNALNLADAPCIGNFFTWTNGRVKAKLDRVMLDANYREAVNRPFKFFNMWLAHPSFPQILGDAWRTVIRAMNEDRQKLQLLRKQACFYAEVECQFFSQKLKLKNGDKGTKIFHDVVKKSNRDRSISCILNQNGQPTSSLAQVGDLFVDFFKDLLGSSRNRMLSRADFLSNGPLISSSQHAVLTKEVSNQEIKDALFDVDDKKSPGPDGYSAAFFKKNWEVIGEDLTDAVHEFFQSGQLLKHINYTVIALIPKTQQANVVGDFWPISCCNVIYKVISKVLAERLSNVLPSLIDRAQAAFIGGRSMSDNIFLAQELIRCYARKRISPRLDPPFEGPDDAAVAFEFLDGISMFSSRI